MHPQTPLRESEAANWSFFLSLPETDPKRYNPITVKGSQFIKPLFEFSGACAGCGETPYVKLLSQLFGDRALIANATGCSSIYGGNLPTTPYTTRKDGRGPAWNNSLFEDNAEMAFGMRLAVDKFTEFARELIATITADGAVPAELKATLGDIASADQSNASALDALRAKVDAAKKVLAACADPLCRELASVIEYMVGRSVWAVGGDGWAYDIGYGGLDHVLAAGRNINVLVLDTEVYSNTGGQSSKATPMGAVAKFAASGKPLMKKDLGMIAMSYGYVYVAKVAMGANNAQTVKAFVEAENYNGPSLILCYANCINQGYDMINGNDQQKKAVDSGHWPLYRYNPDLALQGKNPLQLDCKEPTLPLADYVYNENRYKMLQRSNPEVSKQLIARAEQVIAERFRMLKLLAGTQQ